LHLGSPFAIDVAVEAAPTFLQGFDQFEDHGRRDLEAAFRSDRAVPHGGEGTPRQQQPWASASVIIAALGLLHWSCS
jgi:hypothetical protein